MDLSQSIKTIASIFHESERPTGEEDEPFKYKLASILERMEFSEIPEQHRISVLFAALKGKARDTAAKLKANSKDIDRFLENTYKSLI